MNEQTQTDLNNLYHGNYENDYMENLAQNSSEDEVFVNSEFEMPKYMNLGAPRERDEEDHFHHEFNMSNLKGEDVVNSSFLGLSPKLQNNIEENIKYKNVAKNGAVKRFLAKYLNVHFGWPHFRLVKTGTVSLGGNGIGAKIKGLSVALFLGLSIASFLTQTTFLVMDIMRGEDVNLISILSTKQNRDINDGNIKIEKNKNILNNELLGSDDGRESVGDDSSKKTNISNKQQYRLNDVKNFPALSSKSFLIADIKSGEIIRQSQDDNKYPIASVSKLMTAVIAQEKMDQKQMAIVSRSSYNTFGTQGELLLGESIRVGDLMYPLLMESSNDAAEVLADAYGHEKFMSEMNKKAVLLEMNDTYYEDPSGLSPKNTSTVEDQFKLAKYIFENQPVIFDLTRVRQFEILNHKWYSKNKILNMPEFIGGKNGFIDESRQTTTSVFDVQIAKGGKRTIAIILLRTNDREGDVVRILNFLKKNAYYDEVLD